MYSSWKNQQSLFEAGLASFVAVEQPGVMADVCLPLGDKGKDAKMLIPLAFIVGDNQGRTVLLDIQLSTMKLPITLVAVAMPWLHNIISLKVIVVC